jgi:transcriptional regulator
MYIPPVFKTDDDTALKFAAARGFGTLIAVDQGRPMAAHLPFLMHRGADGVRVELHVARANPLHEIIAKAPEVLLTVLGPDTYISPDWYVSADQVPTWNYVTVHLGGTARAVPHIKNLDHADRLSAQFEHKLLPKTPWTSSKMTVAKREAMLRAIVGIEIAITTVEAQWKLGQHKSVADQESVVRNLEQLGTGQPYLELLRGWKGRSGLSDLD